MLAGAWRQVLKDKYIDNAMLFEKISLYTDSLTNIPLKRRAQIRGNMRTDAMKGDLTWYTFCKNLRALGVTELEIEFTCKHIRRYSTHRLKLTLDDEFVTKGKNKEEKEIPESTGPNVLSRLFTQMCFDLGVDYPTFEMLLELYMRRTSTGTDNDIKQTKNDLRAYIRKGFKSDNMSWDMFLKGFGFLCVIDVHMKLVLTQAYGFVSEHRYSFTLGDLEDFRTEQEDDTGI